MSSPSRENIRERERGIVKIEKKIMQSILHICWCISLIVKHSLISPGELIMMLALARKSEKKKRKSRL